MALQIIWWTLRAVISCLLLGEWEGGGLSLLYSALLCSACSVREAHLRRCLIHFLFGRSDIIAGGAAGRIWRDNSIISMFGTLARTEPRYRSGCETDLIISLLLRLPRSWAVRRDGAQQALYDNLNKRQVTGLCAHCQGYGEGSSASRCVL